MKTIGIMLWVFLAAVLGAQPQVVEGIFSEVPFWPTGAKQPPADLAAKHFVYFDPAAEEYVMSYPEGLERGESGGPRVNVRHQPGFVVDPEISVSVSKDKTSGRFIYDYTLKNGPKAKNALRFFKIVGASDDDDVKPEHPRWLASVGSSNAAPEAGMRPGHELRIRANMGKFISWTSSSSPPIAPGLAESGFRVTSRFRPGITTAYSLTGNALRTPKPLPPEVMEQLIPLLAIEKDAKISLTIGPKFGSTGPGKSAVWVADDYALGIRRLIDMRRLSADSAFVQNLLSALDLIAQTAGGGDAGDPMYATVKLQTKPSTPLERELEQAVLMALQP